MSASSTATPTASTTDTATGTITSQLTASQVTSTGNQGNTGNGGNGGAGSSLYLFTFLATLFLLLFVSCAIVLRSFFLRRRFRRRIEEAIAAGVLLPPASGHGRRRDFGEKPKIWDAWAAPSGEEWSDIVPVSAKKTYASSHLSSAPAQGKLTGRSEPNIGSRMHVMFGRRLPLFADRNNMNASLTTSPSSASTPSRFLSRTNSSADVDAAVNDAENDEESLAQGMEKKRLQVSVLIAMPSPHGSVKGKERSISVGHDDWDEEFPDVLIGTTEVPFRKTTPTTPLPVPVSTPSS
ncbi:hypothetical protein PUNSTDRAFT_141278 [Punctularia strigosozonata HHB-11173 SS5]|uniref:uncharacterized protein n=1 Tax=Punctularia strigosozonata (strain HHB-11173) TaxID=741275 RepID=UPI00044180A9|nr:uncharacterized protein PUNSTDRAFT_141278 [Punctularia strigosozonata HHB-11173 SS5]EIN12620.1 hypothetical protein PUNSTDRAFT_141278 [Punctularia strigosozonata HHB-11173 SS5]